MIQHGIMSSGGQPGNIPIQLIQPQQLNQPTYILTNPHIQQQHQNVNDLNQQFSFMTTQNPTQQQFMTMTPQFQTLSIMPSVMSDMSPAYQYSNQQVHQQHIRNVSE
jgi:hypothetical protein